MSDRARNNFLITGTGRCGTAFLASTMNLSRRWTVAHEPVQVDERDPADAIRRLDRDFYGEVNGRLRFCFPEIKVNRRGVILRDPRAVLTSAYSRHPEWFGDLASLESRYRENYRVIERCLAVEDTVAISFELMTSDPDYLGSLLHWFGVEDVEITPAHSARVVNPNRRAAAAAFDDLDEKIQDAGMRGFGWFMERYGDLLHPNTAES